MLVFALWASSDPSYYSRAFLIPDETPADESFLPHDDLFDHSKDDPSSIVVQTTNGPVSGFVHKLPTTGDSVDVFLGVSSERPLEFGFDDPHLFVL